MKKTELYEIIKLKKPKPVHKTDEFLRGKGHDVFRLPPYHCEFNPIEMVWEDVKGYVGRENNTFKTNDIKDYCHDPPLNQCHYHCLNYNNFWNVLYNVVRFPILWFYFVFNMITKVSHY
jgi:transposase